MVWEILKCIVKTSRKLQTIYKNGKKIVHRLRQGLDRSRLIIYLDRVTSYVVELPLKVTIKKNLIGIHNEMKNL